jgi:hypothetical protein
VAGVVEENYEDEEFVIAITDSDGRLNDQWVLDTACTSHMSPKRDWLTTYESIKGGSVFMGNNVAYKIVGIGAVRIMMHDGTVKTLKNVRHVPNLKRNLIFLGTLDTLGYKYSGGGGVIRVSEGSLVVMEGNKIDGLYFLQGSTVTDSANLSSSDNFRQSTVLAQQSEDNECFMSHLPYSSAFESIMYVMVCICPYVSHAVSVVGPDKVHWPAMKCIPRCLQGVTDVGLVFDKGSGIRSSVIGYVNSDYAGDLVVA